MIKFFFSLVFLIFADQISKIWAEETFRQNPMEVIPNLLNFVLVYNKGVAFGMMSSWDDTTRVIVLSIVWLMAGASLLYLYFVDFKASKLGSIALTLILAGALGNIIDRVRVGAVVDFIDFYFGSYHWPAFNFADSYICIGAGLIFILSFKAK